MLNIGHGHANRYVLYLEKKKVETCNVLCDLLDSSKLVNMRKKSQTSLLFQETNR